MDTLDVLTHHARPIPPTAVRRLYDLLGWWPHRSAAAIAQALTAGPAVAAWDGPTLVGLARAVRSHSFCALSHRSCARNPTVCEPSYRCPLRLCETPRPQGTGRTDRRTNSGIFCRVAHELWDVWLKNSGMCATVHMDLATLTRGSKTMGSYSRGSDLTITGIEAVLVCAAWRTWVVARSLTDKGLRGWSLPQ